MVAVSLKKKIFFLPKPELNYSVDKNIKEEKKVKFISIKVFNSLSEQSFNNISLIDKNTVIGYSFVVAEAEIKSGKEMGGFITEIVTPKTKVHSPDQEGSFYHETDIQLIPIESDEEKYFPHFYFMYELSCSEEQEKEFLTCLRILADEGIGDERSSGKGLFEEIIETEIDLNFENSSAKRILVSMCNPQTQQEFDSFEYYDILIRGGGSVSFDTLDDKEENKPEYSDYRKKQVRMIAEGAIVNDKIKGRLVEVSPDKGAEHKYFRNGKSFTIPLG